MPGMLNTLTSEVSNESHGEVASPPGTPARMWLRAAMTLCFHLFVGFVEFFGFAIGSLYLAATM